jgi:hypothetical protein
VLLPDHVFFVRVVPLAAGGLPADIPAQVELVLDGLTPFSVAQLCYGYFTRPGAERAVVYAAYRRRFTVEDAKTWVEADVVLPAFATCFGLAPTKPETLLLSGPDFITAIAWDGRNAVPAVVRTRAVEAETPAAERSAIEAELVSQMKDFPVPVRVAAPKESASRIGDSGLEFLVGDQISRFDSAQLDAVDVRDKAELSARRRARGAGRGGGQPP